MATRGTIAVIDDTEQNRYTVTRYLRRAGYEVVEGKTGAEALALAQRNPLLVVLDVRLPDILGHEVCRKIKTSPDTAHIPVLQTSASFTATSDKAVGLEAGADAYLISPFEPEELLATVKALIRTREAEVIARAAAAEWHATFEGMRDAVCLIDANDCIERVNGSFRAFFGNAAENVVGRSFLEFADAACVPQKPLDDARRGAKSTHTYWCGPRCFQITVDPVNHAGVRKGFVIAWSDVTELQQAMEQIRELNGELEKRVELRTADLKNAMIQLESFAYTVAHDLRTPLRAIDGYASAIDDAITEGSRDEVADYLQRMRQSVVRMNYLITDLLQYARLGKQVELPAEIQLTPFVETIAKEMIDGAGQPGKIDIQPDLPTVSAHRSLLQQVFSNLLNNALKFRKPGQPAVIRVRAETAPLGFVRILVEDEGIGIAPEAHERVFEMFERVHSSTDLPGSGIGLAIVRRCMRIMNGHVRLESSAGKGTRFILDLPASAAGAAYHG